MKIRELFEASLKDFDDILDKFETFLRKCDPKYFPHLKGVYGEELRGSYNFKMCRKVIEHSELTNKVKSPKWSGEPRLCYDNAMRYAKAYPEVDLCWGYMIGMQDMRSLIRAMENDGDGLKHTSISIVEHAFCMEGDYVVDPTWHENAYYCYIKVPKEDAESFGEDDKKFVKYIKQQREKME